MRVDNKEFFFGGEVVSKGQRSVKSPGEGPG